MKIQVQKEDEFRGHSQAVYVLSESWRDGHILSGGADQILAEWNVQTGEAMALAQMPAPIYAIKFLKDAGIVLCGLRNGEIAIIQPNTSHPPRRIAAHASAVFDILVLSHDIVVTSGEDGILAFWDAVNWTLLHKMKVTPKSIRTMVRLGVSSVFAYGTSDHRIGLVDAHGKMIDQWNAHQNSVFRLLQAGPSSALISTGRDAQISFWNPFDQNHLVLSVPAHMFAVNDLVEIGPLQAFASGSMDKSIRFWDFEGKLLKVVDHAKNGCHWNGVNRLLWHEGKLYSCSDDRIIMKWSVEKE